MLYRWENLSSAFFIVHQFKISFNHPPYITLYRPCHAVFVWIVALFRVLFTRVTNGSTWLARSNNGYCQSILTQPYIFIIVCMTLDLEVGSYKYGFIETHRDNESTKLCHVGWYNRSYC